MSKIMKVLSMLLLLAITVSLLNCTTSPNRVVIEGSGITQADVDRAYQEGFRAGNKQGFTRGYDHGHSGLAFSYVAPAFVVGSGFAVYHRGVGFTDTYGVSSHYRSTNIRNTKNVTNVTNVTNVKNVKNTKNIKNKTYITNTKSKKTYV